MRNVLFQIARGNAVKSYMQEYRLPITPHKTLIWWLTKIQEEMDLSLNFPISCRAGLCGGCGVVLNGRSVLSCETMLDDEMINDGKAIRVEPLKNFPVLSDLVVDWRSIADHMKKIFPQDTYCRVAENAIESNLKLEVSQELIRLGACTTCGLCVSECPAMSNGAFIPPYIFVKSQAVFVDPRIDDAVKQMLYHRLISHAGYCLKCGKCAAVCPGSLSPEAEIKRLFA